VHPRDGLDYVEKRPYQDPNSDPSVVQLVDSRYTDYDILAPVYQTNNELKYK
jgi:hypothetical protein